MSFFNRKEFYNLIFHAKRNPILALRILADLSNLFLLRALQVVLRRHTSDIHHAGRKRPTFIEPLSDIAEPLVKHIFLPPLPQKEQNFVGSIFSERTSIDSDIEEFYFRHRWSQCVHAMWSDRRVAISVLNEVKEWIDTYKDHQKIEWEPYSSSERVANLAVLLAVRPGLIENMDQAKYISFLCDSLYWIDAHLEYYPGVRTNNHILNNARAMVIAGSSLGRVDAIEKGIRLFVEMSKKMISAHGFLRERSTHYQVVIANWLMDTIWFAKPYLGKSAIIKECLQLLEATADNMIKATGKILAGTLDLRTNIGDISPDLCPSDSLLRLKYLHNHPENGELNHGVDISDGWFFARGYNQSVVGNIPYPGYPLKHPTHGHNDLGSFTWAIGDHVVLTDAGRYRYTKDTVSEQQIVGVGHNCLLVDGFSPLAEPLNINGGWNPAYYSSAFIQISQSGENKLELNHTGFARIPDVADHTRIITLEENKLVVEDIISGSLSHNVQQRWHFPPSAKVETENGRSIIQIADKQIACVSSLHLEGGSAGLNEYYDSQQYGTANLAVCLQFSNHVMLPITIKTIFSF